MNKRLAEIRSRKEEIRTALESNETVDLRALQDELAALDTEQKELEERDKIAAQINLGQKPEGIQMREKPMTEPKTIESEEYRKAFMDYGNPRRISGRSQYDRRRRPDPTDDAQPDHRKGAHVWQYPASHYAHSLCIRLGHSYQ